ncbi:unnamed protein product [Adineta ricciae]|uniref:Uncharacterized protein n=1 Tax=Adineta ricciae TaxID=249248 RepID=A0A813RRJ2_ADIRI|nr:unnamed protein product [Adineta ricciae]CAF1169777.1 unnamed protein product [Adineta ricciae]
MSGKESTGHDLVSMIKTNPLISQPNDEQSNKKHEKESGDFDNDDIQKKMSGLIHNLQSGSPDQSDKTPTKVDAERIRSPVAEKQAERPSRSTSPQVSKPHEVSKIRPASLSSSSDDEKKKKKGAQRDSSDEHHRNSSKSPKPEMKHDSSQTKHDTTATANTHKNARSSSTDSEDLPRSTSKKTQAKHSPRDGEKRSSSRESKKERLNNSKASQKEKPKPKSTHSTDDDTTDDEHHTSKSKKKTTNDEHHKTTDEDTHVKKTHSIQDLVNKSIKPSDPHSDTEQAKPKRRRPKRISRTTQTYEHIFRRMERDQHEELVPTNDTDKNCQTRKSQLSPQKRSSKKSYSIYISSDDYKFEPVNSKKSSSDQRKSSNTRKSAPESGKLLILRPTQSDHHSKAISTQRITSEQAIDLIRNDKKQDSSSADQRAKSKTRKQPEHAQKLPRVNSPASSTEHDHPHKANAKGKTKKNAADDSL